MNIWVEDRLFIIWIAKGYVQQVRSSLGQRSCDAVLCAANQSRDKTESHLLSVTHTGWLHSVNLHYMPGLDLLLLKVGKNVRNEIKKEQSSASYWFDPETNLRESNFLNLQRVLHSGKCANRNISSKRFCSYQNIGLISFYSLWSKTNDSMLYERATLSVSRPQSKPKTNWFSMELEYDRWIGIYWHCAMSKKSSVAPCITEKRGLREILFIYTVKALVISEYFQR